MASGRRKKPTTVLIRMRVSAKLHGYLGHLAAHTILGGDENDVATYLLTKQLEQMMARRFHETERPPSDEDEA